MELEHTDRSVRTRVCTRLFPMQDRASSEKRSREACRPEASLRGLPHISAATPGGYEGLFVSIGEQNIFGSLACDPTYDVWFICTLALGLTRVSGGSGEPTRIEESMAVGTQVQPHPVHVTSLP